jgi:SAM-dependent methyltransferase
MSGFSAEWLALREAIDHRSRDHGLEQALARHFTGHTEIAVTDIGCGTGSNLRATFALLPKFQTWTLVDYDQRLLDVARAALIRWAELVVADGEALRIRKAGRHLTVHFRCVDLARDLDAGLGERPALVTASAFFDITASEFIGRFADAVAQRRAAFYTVLTYNGVQTWSPSDAADAAMAAAFHAHQTGVKEFGPAAGPQAPMVLRQAFASRHYAVSEGDSPWKLGVGDRRLLGALASGFADAVAETGKVSAADIARWRAVAHTGGVVGHTDTLALPT